MQKLGNYKKLLFLEVAHNFRDIADLIEGLDCLSNVVLKDDHKKWPHKAQHTNALSENDFTSYLDA